MLVKEALATDQQDNMQSSSVRRGDLCLELLWYLKAGDLCLELLVLVSSINKKQFLHAEGMLGKRRY